MWRFPYVAAQNGGGAFLVPFFIALITAGIPIMIIEYGLGRRSQSSANVALGAIKKPLRFVGWLSIMAAFGINIYYCIVLGWVFNFFIPVADITSWAVDITSSKLISLKIFCIFQTGPGISSRFTGRCS